MGAPMPWKPACLTAVVALAALPMPAAAFGLLDDIGGMQADIDAWEEAGTADFSDVEARLNGVHTAVFSDVATTDWFAPYVATLAEWRIVSGYKDASGALTGAFRPGSPVTLGEMLKMALIAARIDTSACAAATGTGSEHWASGYARCAKAMRVRVNLDNLDAPALRWEVITLLHDAFGDQPQTLYAGFADVRGHPAESDIAYAALRGIITGDDGTGAFRPNDRINRAEVSKILVQRIRFAVRRKVSESF